jgi:hypothetical protein
VQQFFKNAAEVKGEEPLSSPAGDETPRAILRHTERWVRKATAFRGRANKTALPTNRPKQYSLKMFRGNIFKLIKIDSRGLCPLDPCQRADSPFGIPILDSKTKINTHFDMENFLDNHDDM